MKFVIHFRLYTDVTLAEELESDYGLTIVGTVMQCRKHLPRELLDISHREPMSSLFAYSSPVTMVSYVPKGKKKKNVLLLSTMHPDGIVMEERMDKKPEIILFYNDTKAGVDTVDQMCRTFTIKTATRRWPTVIFFNLLDIAGRIIVHSSILGKG